MNDALTALLRGAEEQLTRAETALREIESKHQGIAEVVASIKALVIRLNQAKESLTRHTVSLLCEAMEVARLIPDHLIVATDIKSTTRHFIRIHRNRQQFQIHIRLKVFGTMLVETIPFQSFVDSFDVIGFCQAAFDAAEQHLAQSKSLDTDAQILKAPLEKCAEIAAKMITLAPQG